jgi:hypothetical protein
MRQIKIYSCMVMTFLIAYSSYAKDIDTIAVQENLKIQEFLTLYKIKRIATESVPRAHFKDVLEAYGYKVILKNKEVYLAKDKKDKLYEIILKAEFANKSFIYHYISILPFSLSNEYKCHACEGHLSVLKYKIQEDHIHIQSIENNNIFFGAWGDFGAIYPVQYNDGKTGFILSKTDNHQDEYQVMIRGYEFDPVGIKEKLDLRQIYLLNGYSSP